MEIVETKFNSFKQFCLDILPNNEFVALLQGTSLDLFLTTMKIKRGQMRTEDEIICAIMSKAKLKEEDFTQDQLKRFRRYVQYFDRVCSVD